jgi:hypothetical protein
MVLYWYGLETADERGWAWRTLAPRLRAAARSLWAGWHRLQDRVWGFHQE